jgi:hypothetical protein
VVVLSSLNTPVPLLIPPEPTYDTDCLEFNFDSKAAYRSFEISSRVALAVGAAIGCANEPRPAALAASTYGNTYDRMETLVRNLISSAKTVADSHVFCEGTLLAFR